MKQLFLTVLFLIAIAACNKSNDDNAGNGPGQPPASLYTCYLSTTEDYDHIVTNRYTYNDQHFLIKHETYQGGYIRDIWLYYKNATENWIQEDHFAHDVGGDYYQSYKKFYFSSNHTVDSMAEYQCVDCSKLNPTQFKRSWYWVYEYNQNLQLTKSQYYSLPHTPNGYSSFEYDNQGRLTKESAYSQDGKLAYSYGYRYTNIDSAKMLMGEPDDITKGLYGYSRVYRETFLDYYTSTTGKTETIQWDNQRNPDGYMNATANSKYGTLISYFKYACFKK